MSLRSVPTPEAVYALRRDHYTWGVRKVADEIVRVMPSAEWPELFAALHAELDACAAEVVPQTQPEKLPSGSPVIGSNAQGEVHGALADLDMVAERGK